MQRNEIKIHLMECKFAAVMVDGNTDNSITENEMVYIQTCKDGVVKPNFVCCCQVQQGTAMGVINAIQRAVTPMIDWPDFLRKLVALSSDGAAVMLGKTGVISLLQAEQPSMIVVHCSGHRLELAYKDAIKKFPPAEEVVTLLSGLFYMYRNSLLNRTNLKSAYRCLGHKILMPTRAGGT